MFFCMVVQVHTFKIGIFPGAILPFIIGYWADAATAVGDITATEEASGIEQRGPAHDERIQGCLLADGEWTLCLQNLCLSCCPSEICVHCKDMSVRHCSDLLGFRVHKAC